MLFYAGFVTELGIILVVDYSSKRKHMSPGTVGAAGLQNFCTDLHMV